MDTFVAFPLLAMAIGAYEWLIHARILCSGDCNIRIDLLLVYPILLLVSAVALWNTARATHKRAQVPLE